MNTFRPSRLDAAGREEEQMSLNDPTVRPQ